MFIHSTKLVISEKNQLAAFYKNNVLEELIISHSNYQIGSIYVGVVEKLVPNINAAFIKLDKIEKNGFIQLDKLNAIPNKLGPLILLEYKKKLVVQIVKEPTGTKGPSVTTNIGIMGQYLILLPFSKGVNISKKIYNNKDKNQLKALLFLLKPLSMGILIKKEAYKQDYEKIIKDFLFLQKKWGSIQIKAKKLVMPSRLTEDIYFIKKIIKNFSTRKLDKILIDTKLGAWNVYKILLTLKKPLSPKTIKLIYSKSQQESIIKGFHIDFDIHSLLQPRVNLVTGGYIIIEKTEALTAIDINSGSFNKVTTSRTSLLWINCEAATEISKQLKLRNLGGIIVIDFIDMSYQKDQMILLNHLNNVLKNDHGKPKIIQLSEIGLVELTRKREGQNIYDIFGKKCESCNGIGHSTSFLKFNTKLNLSHFGLEMCPIYSNTRVY